jgi:hypothetical protein
MIVIVSWESMINDLLKNDNKMINQIFVCRRINFGLCLKVVQGASHDTGVFITESFLHFLIHLLNRNNLMELEKDHNSFFPNHLMLMIQECYNLFIYRHYNMLIA